MRTLHLVSHTHWDREWYLTFQQFRLKLVHLMDGLLDLLAEDPDYRHFMLDGQTIVLDDYLQVRPERLGELCRYVQNGRLVIGPWHVLPDEFLVSPEAILRNLELGDQTARRFGPKMMVGYIPDPFGHIGQMPQILRGFGIQTAAVQRGLADQPCELWWQAPDGSRVLLANLKDGYGNAAGLLTSDPERFTAEVRRLGNSLLPHSACGTDGHLLLMHGTDHMEPPPDTAQAIQAANQVLEGEVLVHSTLAGYLQAAAAELDLERLPVVSGELRHSKRHHLLPNVLSARMWIKQRNHTCQTLLEKWAEPFSAWAEAVRISGGVTQSRKVQPGQAQLDGGEAYISQPPALLAQAWRMLLECHPHDSICGCSIDQVHAEMRPRFDQVEQIGEAITRQSLEMIAANIDTRPPAGLDPEAGEAVVVFNPAAGPRNEAVLFETDLPGDSGSLVLMDDQGQRLPLEVQGLGSRALIDMELDKKSFISAFGMVHDGRVAGMVVRQLEIEKQGRQAEIRVVMSDSGQTDPDLWKNGLQAVDALIADPEIQAFHVKARSAQAARLLFYASGLPGSGYRTFWIRPGEAGQSAGSAPQKMNRLAKALLPLGARLAQTPLAVRFLEKRQDTPLRKERLPKQAAIENEFFRVEVSPADGALSLLDKRNGRLYSGMNRFVDGGDCGDEYNYSPPARDRLVDRPQVLAIHIHNGPVQQQIEVRLRLETPASLSEDHRGRSPRCLPTIILTRLALTQGTPRLDICTEVDNPSCDHRLRVHFPTGLRSDTAVYDGHFQLISRPVDLPAWDESWAEPPRPEVPQRAFTGVWEAGKGGLVIANRGLPEVETLRNPQDGTLEVALTLLRCVGWLSRDDFVTRKGHAGPMLATPDAQMIGRHRFEYAIIPSPETDPQAGLAQIQQAYAFNALPRVKTTGLHAGLLPAQGSLVEVTPGEFIISAIKASKDGRGWIVRGYNISQEDVGVKIRPWKIHDRVERVSLSEEMLQEQSQLLSQAIDGSVTFSARPNEIITIKLS